MAGGVEAAGADAVGSGEETVVVARLDVLVAWPALGTEDAGTAPAVVAALVGAFVGTPELAATVEGSAASDPRVPPSPDPAPSGRTEPVVFGGLGAVSAELAGTAAVAAGTAAEGVPTPMLSRMGVRAWYQVVAILV